MKFRPVGAELSQADGHTDRWTRKQKYMTKLIVGFLNLANVPNELQE